MKEILQQLAAYNLWANGLLLEAIKKIPPEMHEKEVASSFSSLLKTIVHMWNAESVWWQRMKLKEQVVEPKDNFKGNLPEAVDEMMQQCRQWKDWVVNSKEHHLDHVFEYRNFSGVQFKQPIFQVLIHLFNHETYHRGQLVTMLRQLGIEKIPQTDFIVWSRKR